MRDPRHPRHFTSDFKRQTVDPYNAGKSKREITDEYEPGKSTVERWIKSINATGSPRAAGNRTPEQNRILELERENRRLRMEVDVPLHALAAHATSKGRYGPRKIKASLEGSGATVSRRRVCRIMGGERPGQRIRQEEVQGAPRGGQRGRRAQRHRARLRRQGAAHPYMRRPDLRARRGLVELRLHARRPLQQGDRQSLRRPRKDARSAKSAFATLSLPISDIKAFRTGRGCEFDNAEIDLMLEAFGIERSLSAKGCPCNSAVDESTNRILKAGLVPRETFGTTSKLRAKLSDYVHRYGNFRIHSTLGYMSSVEFREAGLSLPESSK